MKKWKRNLIKRCAKNNFLDFENCIQSEKIFNIPKKLYKYCCFDEQKYNLKNLLNNVHYLNNPINFNDPYDSRICYYFNDVLYDITKLHIINSMNLSSKIKDNVLKLLDKGYDIFQIYKKYRRNWEVKEDLDFIIEDIQENVEEIYINKLTEFISNNIKITCFSEKKDNILMWAHYAKNHTGFCIEYDLTGQEFSNFIQDLYPVFYTNKPFKRFETEADISSYSFLLLTFLTKYKDWSYEKEWRYLKVRTDNSFIQMPTTPSCIYLGTKITPSNQKLISDLCKMKKIPCHKMFMRADKFYVQPSNSYY